MLSINFQSLRNNISQLITSGTQERVLVQGDFNINEESFRNTFPSIFTKGFEEVLIQEDTTPRGRKYDHVLYKGLTLKSFKIDNQVLTDHYSLISEFEVI